jgi:hypothetical protein
MLTPVADIGPALFRAGDIGVAAEWRDLSYDWTPVLTPIGVSMYEHCRDTYDQQRALFPFLLSPQGPTKQAMQRKLGQRTGYALEGPEYLLATVGLLHVEVGTYGPSADPERPNHTRVAYYVVGRLDRPTLDWPMLDRLLTAVHCALEPDGGDEAAARQQKKAMAALRSLGQAGFLQLCDPEDLLYPLGAWPYLLPTLMADSRWEALFTHLHGAAAMHQYRQQGRAWVEYARRVAERLRLENEAIRDQILAAQRRGPHGGPSSPPTTPSFPPIAEPSSTRSGEATALREPAGATSGRMPATRQPVSSAQPGGVSETGRVAGLSLASRYPGGVSETGSATTPEDPHRQMEDPQCVGVAGESLLDDQLTSRPCCQVIDPSSSLATPGRTADPARASDILPAVAPHLRDEELATTRYDGTFWCAVNTILYGGPDRYPHTPGEKKAVERRFKRQAIPVGVVLAALRAVMTMPHSQRPQRFGAALTMDVFHACIDQALALVPMRDAGRHDQHDWPAFVQAYRSIGMANELRNVSTTDYHALYGLFQAHPTACWEVLSRVEHASTVPNLSPAYIRRAVINNQQAAARYMLDHAAVPPACARGTARPTPEGPAHTVSASSEDDPRAALLDQAGLSRKLLEPWMTTAYIQAWLDEAAARPNLENVQGWLIWALGERCLPHEHPKLPPRPADRAPERFASKPAGAAHRTTVPRGVPAPDAAQPVSHPDYSQIWTVVLDDVQRDVPGSEFATWLIESTLLDLTEDRAVVGVPHIFAREHVERCYREILGDHLSGVVQRRVNVQVVIGTSASV